MKLKIEKINVKMKNILCHSGVEFCGCQLAKLLLFAIQAH